MVAPPRAVLVALLLLLPVVSAPPTLAAEPPATAKIRESELRDHVRVLADDRMAGRLSGTKGAENAAAYISREFARAGLLPGGTGGTWLQQFFLPGGEVVPAGCSMAVTGPRGFTPTCERDWRPFRFGQGATIHGAGIVFAGFGIQAPRLGYDDYAGVDVRGKVVVALRHGPRERMAGDLFRGTRRKLLSFLEKARAAEAAGAAALLIVNDLDRHPGQADDCPTGMTRAEGGVQIPVIFVTRPTAEAMFAAAGEDLAALMQAIDATGRPATRELAGIGLDLVVRTTALRTANVIGVLPGADPALADEAIVVGAHYDHVGYGKFGSRDSGTGLIHNGADDNASGVSALIEIAERFAMTAERPRRTIIFIAFSGEELGLIGSRFYVAHPGIPLARTVAMLNLDMIGRGEDGKLFIGGTATSPAFPPLIEQAAAEAGLHPTQSPVGYAASDNTSFHERGVPVLFFHTGLHDDYHTSRDDWDKLAYPELTRVAGAVATVLDGLARADAVLPAADLGARLAVGAGSPGLLVRSVRAGSAGEVAGILAGDRILLIGGQRVENGLEYRRVLGRLSRGDRVVVRVLRAGEEIPLEVAFTAGAR